MIAFFILPHAEFGLNDHREDTHFIPTKNGHARLVLVPEILMTIHPVPRTPVLKRVRTFFLGHIWTFFIRVKLSKIMFVLQK